MPGLPDLDDFPFEEQEEPLSCVPCCVLMVCQYLGIEKEWEEICREIGYSSINGTDFEQVGNLSSVLVFEAETIVDIASALAGAPALPVISHVTVNRSGHLTPAGPGASPHAVVAVAVTATRIVYIDPLARSTFGHPNPVEVPLVDFGRAFLGAWVIVPY